MLLDVIIAAVGLWQNHLLPREDGDEGGAAPERRPRKVRRQETGPRSVLNPHAESLLSRRRWPGRNETWDELFLQDPSVETDGSYKNELFRESFNVPWAVFSEIREKAKDRWPQGRGPKAHDLDVKVLGCLYHLTTGIKASKMPSVIGMSKTTSYKFLVQFLEWLGQDVYEEKVAWPEGERMNKIMQVFKNLGFPGCQGSIDGLHLVRLIALSLSSLWISFSLLRLKLTYFRIILTSFDVLTRWLSRYNTTQYVDSVPAALHHLATGKEGKPTMAWCVILSAAPSNA